MTEQHETPGGVSGGALRGPDGSRPGDGRKDIPQATVARLATYLRVLAGIADEGVAIVSSEELAVAAGVNSAKLRKDLSFLGPNGVRGVGYDVGKLRARIEDVLGLAEGHRVVLVGAGNLGRALVGYGGFRRRGFSVVGIFDSDPRLVGAEVAGLTVADVAHLADQVGALAPTIAVIAVPDDAAQVVCDRLVAAGLHAILSFAPCELHAPDTVEIRRVDLAVEMQMLSFETARNAPLPEVAHAVSGRIARRAPGARGGGAANRGSGRTRNSSSHSATEPSSKGSVVTP
ncbi:redox-sensing transcriptional repressor Rex [Nocardia sp. NPDC057353]|uniref:redox-sensing transcriptional repressor Rex n=1 Tax=Nocardia sp. NPDC057353 TaxID=3346104 RepID=UPI00363237B5